MEYTQSSMISGKHHWAHFNGTSWVVRIKSPFSVSDPVYDIGYNYDEAASTIERLDREREQEENEIAAKMRYLLSK